MSATELLEGILLDGGADLARAPDDFVEAWLNHDTDAVCLYGDPADILGAVDVAPRRLRCAVKFAVPTSRVEIESILLAEQQDDRGRASVAASPSLFLSALCNRLGAASPDKAALDIRQLPFRGDLLLSPAWRSGIPFGILMVEVDDEARVEICVPRTRVANTRGGT